MASPEKKLKSSGTGAFAQRVLPAQRVKLTHSAPWSFQRRSETVGFALIASLIGPLALFGVTTLTSPTFLLEWAVFFSLSFFSFRAFIFSPRDSSWKSHVTLLFQLGMGWCVTLGLYFWGFSKHFGRVSFSESQITQRAFLIPLGLWLLFFALKKTRPLLHGTKLRALIVGITPVGKELYTRNQASVISDLNIVGFFDFRKEPRVALPLGATFLDSAEELTDHITNEKIDLVIITVPMRQEERILELMNLLADTTASVAFVPDIFQFDLMNSSLGEIAGIPVITLRDTPFYGWKRFVKRAVDLILGGTLLLLLFPLFLVCAFLIKITSPGPVFYRQKRVGLGTNPLEIWKFRSMHVQPGETYPQPAERSDPRITSLGKWLRKYSIDELPQLVNVIRGEMSLVGPRPFAWEHSQKYRSLIQGYSLRHKIKPGMTGWAQINGQRGLIESSEQLQTRVDYDLYYVKHWSLFFDCLILLRSIPKVFIGDENAF